MKLFFEDVFVNTVKTESLFKKDLAINGYVFCMLILGVAIVGYLQYNNE